MERVVPWAITALLATAAAVALATVGWELAKPQLTRNELEGLSTALVLLVLTVAYALAHRRRALHWVAISLFLVSSWALVARWGLFFGGYLKNYAPLSAAEAESAFWETLALFCLAAIGVVVAWLVATRASRGPAVRSASPGPGAANVNTDA
jgi:hypothetical protein